MARYRKAAVKDEIPDGAGKAILVGGKEVAVFNLAGRFHALENTCPHRGGSLGDGAVEGRLAVCPLHGWKFDIETGQMPMGGGVRTFPVKVDGDDILVEV